MGSVCRSDKLSSPVSRFLMGKVAEIRGGRGQELAGE